MSSRNHWESVYTSKSDDQVSWTQPEPTISLALIREACAIGRVIDVGGGTSVLAERLLDAGFAVAVLDIAASALDRAKRRMGDRASEVEWFVADVTADPDLGICDVWHDRAVFHFLTDPNDRARYVALLSKTLKPGGHAIIATFALDGPAQCSGLDVQRYDGATLAAQLGSAFKLIKTTTETHKTPWGKPQSFQYSVFLRL